MAALAAKERGAGSHGSASGSFVVALHSVRWQRGDQGGDNNGENAGRDLDAPCDVWLCVTLESAAAPLDGVWFAADDENAASRSVELTRDATSPLEYAQSSRALALSPAALVALVQAELQVAVYCGATRSRASDEFWGHACVAFLPALLGDRLQETVCVPVKESADELLVELTVQCDAHLANFALGARVLRVDAPAIVRPPSEWTLPCADEEEALRLCAAPDRNTATYELEVALPTFGKVDGANASDIVRFSGGKLQYTPSGDTAAHETIKAAETAGLTGEWSIAFPTGPVVHRLYLKSTLPRLLEFLEVEKAASAVLRRSNVEPAGRVTATVSLNLNALASPGQTRASVEAPLKVITPYPKEALEQELAGAASNDEKKRLQALLADYDAAIAQPAIALSKSLRAAKTRVASVFEILGRGPLVLEPPAALAPTKAIDELVTPRDLSDEYDQRKDVVADLRTEIRRVVLTVLREYEDAAEEPAEPTASASLSREEKRQRIVFKLNSQGAYHAFKEKLKKRIVPVIRDQFAGDALADNTAASDGGEEDQDDGLDAQDAGATRANVRKKAYFARVYATLMDDVQRVLHETFYASASATSSSATLETTHAGLQPRDDAAVTQRLATLALQALENEVNGDTDKSEALHLDRIAFAEARVAELPLAAGALRPTLGAVWLDYALFCLGQGALDKAGGALRQSLALEPRRLDALIAYGALLCELQDWTAAEVAVKNAVREATAAAADSKTDADPEERVRALATAHALLALFYTESQRDDTGHLALFELLKTQRALRRLRAAETEARETVAPCRSAAWIHLATALHALRLRSTTHTALGHADASLGARDVLSREHRVLQRVVRADLLAWRVGEGEADRAEALLREALELDGTHALAWLVLAQTLLQRESQRGAAVECLQRCLAHAAQQLRAPQRLAAHVQLGLALLQAAQFAPAKAAFLRACEEFPLASTWLGVGIASLRLEQWDAAQAALAEANRLDATNADVWGYLALLALSTGALARARQCVAQALRCELSSPALLRELSSGLVAADRLEDAERLLRRALVFQDSSLARKTLADVLAAQHCAEDALTQYQRALDADSSGDAATRRELLDKCVALLVTLGRPDDAAACRAMAAQLREDGEGDVDTDRITGIDRIDGSGHANSSNNAVEG